VGLSLDRNGLLTLDNTKLSKALTADAASVVNLMARTTGVASGGLMAKFSDVITAITDPTKGVLVMRNESFTKQAKKIDVRVTQEQGRLDAYANQLRRSLGDMDAKVAANKVVQQTITNTFNFGR